MNHLRFVVLLIVILMTVNQGKHLRYVFLLIVIPIHHLGIITVTITIIITTTITITIMTTITTTITITITITITTTIITITTTTTITITTTTTTTTQKKGKRPKKISHHLVSHLIVIHPLLSQTTNHLQFVFHLIASPIPRTNSKRRNSRIIPEFALKWVVRPVSSLVDLSPNAFLQLVTPLPTHILKARNKNSWKGQFVKDHIVIPHHNNFSRNHHRFAFHLIVIPPISPVTNTNLSQRERTKIDHLQSAFHHIVIPFPRIMKM
jgi:hypothetical protein